MFFLQFTQTISNFTLATINDYNYLYQLYNSTNGKYWRWMKPYSEHGYPWDFSNYYYNNPCNQTWQGVICPKTTNCITTNTGQTCSITSLNVNNRNLTGSLPPIVSNLTSLLHYDVSANFIFGHLPIFANTPNIKSLNFSYNLFNSKIPDNFLEVDNVPFLYLIYFSSNDLIGSIPSIFYNLTNSLQYFNVYNNSLTGTISSEIGKLKNILYLNYGDNYFRGLIPHEINQLTSLKLLFLFNNDLTGTIPINIPGLNVLWIDHNRLTGPVPPSLCQSVNITAIAIDNNLLTGTVPKCISTLYNLTIFQVQSNLLGGSLHNVFDPTIQTLLRVIDFSDNSFSGSFPLKVFQLQSLNSLAAVKNCFIGSLPESICNNITKSMEVLSLDGLHTSKTCVDFYWNPFLPSEAGSYATLMEGSIPSCFWTLPILANLHLSGNGFHGTIPDFSALPRSLKDVALTHNRLTGTIPTVVQQHPFTFLDLSFNKLKGIMTNFSTMPLDEGSTYYPNTTLVTNTGLNLTNNRLSGGISVALKNAANIQVLSGNVFACSDHLPKNDPNALNYLCGSTEFDTASLVFTIYFGIITTLIITSLVFSYYSLKEIFWKYLAKAYACVLFLRTYIKVIGEVVKFSYEDPHSLKEEQILYVRYKNLYRFIYSLTLIRKIAIYSTIYIICLCLPIYMLFYELFGDDMNSDDDSNNDSNIYSKYDVKYTWVTTSAFLTGVVPAGVLLILWYGLFLLILYLIFVHYDLHEQETTPLSRMVSTVKDNVSGIVNLSIDHSTSSSSRSNLRPSILSALTSVDKTNESSNKNGIMQFRKTSMQPLNLSECEEKSHNNSNKTEEERSQSDSNNNHTNATATTSFSPFALIRSLSQRSTNAKEDQPNTTDNNGRTRSPSAKKGKSLRPRSYRKSESDSTVEEEEGDQRESLTRSSFITTFRDSIAFRKINNVHDLVQNEEFRNRMSYYSLYLFILLFNTTVSLSSNTFYLIVENSESLDVIYKVLMQVLMAIFKLLWNMIMVRKMVTWVQPFEKSVTRLHVSMLVFNSIVAPWFATAFTDSSCFKEVFVNTESISSSYSLTFCLESIEEDYGGTIHTVCTHYDTVYYSTDFTPTFIYYYTCGTKLLTLYIPVFIYTYAILFIVSSILYVILSFFPARLIPSFIFRRIDGILRPQNRGEFHFQKLIRSRSIQALLTQHIIVLLTYGLNAPILAVIMMVSISFECYVWQMVITRFIKYDCSPTPFSPHYHPITSTILNEENLSLHKTGKEGSGEYKDDENFVSVVVNPIQKALALEELNKTEEEADKGIIGEEGVEMTTVGNTKQSSNDSTSKIEEGKEKVNNDSNSPDQSNNSGSMSQPTQSFELLSHVNPFNRYPRFSILLSDSNGSNGLIPQQRTSMEEENDTSVHFQKLAERNKPEQLRLSELHTTIDDSWMCMYNARWLTLYCAVIFNALILYDFAGDDVGWRQALWVLAILTFLLLVTRFVFTDIVIYAYRSYARYLARREADMDEDRRSSHIRRGTGTSMVGSKPVDAYHYEDPEERPTITLNDIYNMKEA